MNRMIFRRIPIKNTSDEIDEKIREVLYDMIAAISPICDKTDMNIAIHCQGTLLASMVGYFLSGLDENQDREQSIKDYFKNFEEYAISEMYHFDKHSSKD